MKYNAQTAIITGLPVCSFVIYLKRDGKVAQSPYELKLPDSEVVHCFYYRTIKLWELPAEALKQAGLEGLLPLLPLTKNGLILTISEPACLYREEDRQEDEEEQPRRIR